MYQKLLSRLLTLCHAYSTITNWDRALDRGEDISTRVSGGGHLPDDTINAAITEELEIAPFHSVHSLASIIKWSRKTV
jgi:hypothetical protein